MRILVSGLTGQLGHGVLDAARRRGVELVPLVRARRRRSAPDRVLHAFSDATLRERTVTGDVGLPRWGLDDAELGALAPNVDAVLNLAGEVDWTAGTEAFFRANVLGALHGRDCAAELRRRAGRCAVYCSASSVHVAGARLGAVPEGPLGPDGDRTRYEHSKWHGETALLGAARNDDLRTVVARVGGLVGDSISGATLRRTSLYLLADEWDRLPAGLLPRFGRGRVDMLPRDVAGDLLLRVTAAASMAEAPPAIVHVSAGESAPLTDAVLAAAESLDVGGRLRRLRRIPLPSSALVWTAQNAERFAPLSRERGNALIGMRYLALDRIFERDRLASLIGPDLPAVAPDALARIVFGVHAPRRTSAAGGLARYAA